GGINSRSQIGELQIAIRPPMHDTKVELFSPPGDCRIDVGNANAGVIAFHRRERARGPSGWQSGRHAHLKLLQRLDMVSREQTGERLTGGASAASEEPEAMSESPARAC